MNATYKALTKLVVFAVVTIMATAVLASVIGNLTFTKNESYRARFTDATGLLAGDDVRIAGVKVGQITSVSIADRRYAEVGFTVDKAIPLKTSTLARIKYRNLVGQRFLALTEGPGSGARMAKKAEIPLAQTTPALDLTTLFNGFKPLFRALSPKDTNKLSFEIISTLQGEGGTINALLSSTASLTNTIADRDAVIGRTVNNLDAVLATVDQRNAGLSELIVQLQRFVSGLAGDRKAIGDSLLGINALADSTAGLLRDIRPSLRPDIQSLNQTAKNLNDNAPVLDSVLRDLPPRLNSVVRTATYGSWFNFYLCQIDGQVSGLPTGTVPIPNGNASAAVCQ
ncbi:MAG: MCE family protein [Actinomycetota bacterium]|nr:MCE family protein [Actinomycetota bacterium]